ncbi:hypothetical protein [Altererythrobacter sp. MTPC7]
MGSFFATFADSATVIGAGANANAINSVALGAASFSDRDNTVSIG